MTLDDGAEDHGPQTDHALPPSHRSGHSRKTALSPILHATAEKETLQTSSSSSSSVPSRHASAHPSRNPHNETQVEISQRPLTSVGFVSEMHSTHQPQQTIHETQELGHLQRSRETASTSEWDLPLSRGLRSQSQQSQARTLSSYPSGMTHTSIFSQGEQAEDGISHLAHHHNVQVHQLLQLIQVAEERRAADRHFVAGKGYIHLDPVADEERQRAFDATMRDLSAMMESIAQPTRSSQTLSVPTPISPQPGAQQRVQRQQSPTFSSPYGADYERESSDRQRDRLFPPVGQSQSQDRPGSRLSWEREKNPTTRFLREFLHANYDRRIQMLNHRDWDMISSILSERCSSISDEIQREQTRLSKIYREKNNELIQLSAPDKYYDSVKAKAQKQTQHALNVLERKVNIDKESQDRKLKVISQREEIRKSMAEARKSLESQSSKYKGYHPTAMKLWSTVLMVARWHATALKFLQDKRMKEQLERQDELLSRAVKFMQLMIRLKISRRALHRKRNKKNPKYICAYVVSKWSFEVSFSKRQKKKIVAANLIRKFLVDCGTISKTALIINNFRYSVVRIQRWYRSLRLIFQARLQLLLHQWRVYDELKKKDIMSKKNLTTLTKEQRQRIAIMEKEGKKIDFQEFVRENLERAKRGQIKIPQDIKQQVLQSHLSAKLADYHTKLRHFLRTTRQVPDPLQHMLKRGHGYFFQPQQLTPELKSRWPKFRPLMTKDELHQAEDEALKLVMRSQLGSSMASLPIKTRVSGGEPSDTPQS